MERVLGQNNYTKLVEWNHDKDPNLKYSFTRFPGSNGDEDGVAVCPLIQKKGKPYVVFATHIRPTRLESKKSHGLSLEIVAGYNKDSDAQGFKTDENAKKETREETGLEIKKLHRVPDGTNGGSGSSAEYIADCKTPKKIKPEEPDMTELALMSVPLENAIQYIEDLAEKGIDVNSNIYKTIVEAQKIYKVKASDKKVKPQLEWTIAGNKPNELQKDGLKLLAEKKDFIPEAAQPLKEKKGFFRKTWDGFVYVVTFKWLFGKKDD